MRPLAVKTVVVALVCAVSLGLLSPTGLSAQSPGVAPTLIPLSGRLTTATGEPRTGTVVLAVALYDGQAEGTPRFVETQQVTLDAAGGYSVQFGATFPDGLPQYLFTDAPGTRWVAIGVSGEPDPPASQRVMLVSVPYAAKAASAETLAGKPASEFVLANSFREDVRTVLEEEGVRTSGSVSAAAVTLNYLQKGDGGGGTTDSVAFETGGNIGIGTTTPGTSKLAVTSTQSGAPVATFTGADTSTADLIAFARPGAAVRGAIAYDNSGFMRIGTTTNHRFAIGTNSSDRLTVAADGNVGIGTTSPGTSKLAVTGTSPGAPVATFTGADTSTTELIAFARPGAAVRGAISYDNSGFMRIGTTTNHRFAIGTNGADRLSIGGDGAVTISGDVTVNGNIAAKYQDVAEWVDSAEPLEAGSLVVIDQTATNRVKSSRTAYDGRVAGAVSPQPGLILGEPGEGRVLVAQSGRVKVKADARNGAIRPGDLLVSSPTPGHVMRSRPVKLGDSYVHRPGTVVGKALEALPKGRGEILVLLTLQ